MFDICFDCFAFSFSFFSLFTLLSALWLIRQHNMLKDSQIAKLVGITKNSVTSIRNKSYWNYNNLNPKDPVALNLFSQKDLMEALEKAERRIKREKKHKEKEKLSNLVSA